MLRVSKRGGAKAEAKPLSGGSKAQAFVHHGSVAEVAPVWCGRIAPGESCSNCH
jgi:hypothetical protein